MTGYMKDVAPIFVVFALLVLWLVGLLRRWKWACDWTPHGKLWMFDKCSDETRRRIQIVVAVLGMVGCVAMMPWRLKEGAEVAVDENEALFDRIARTVTNGDGSRPENVDSVLVAELAAIPEMDHYGLPRETVMSDSCYNISEFRVELLNRYKPGQIWSGEVRIAEITWELPSDSLLTIWYERRDDRMLPVDSCRYPVDCDF